MCRIKFGVAGPYFFDEEGVTVTMISISIPNVARLRNFLQLRMEKIFEEDGLGVV